MSRSASSLIIAGGPIAAPKSQPLSRDIRARVNHLDIAITADRQTANFIVMLVPRRDFAQTIRSRYGASQAKQIQSSLHPECLSGIGKDKTYRIRRAEVILPVDAEEFRFYDCAYEELLQGLGLINDDNSLPWTMFNDNVQMGFFDIYDQYLVNILYDPRIRPGMTKAEVNKLLPDVLPTVRSLGNYCQRAQRRRRSRRRERQSALTHTTLTAVRSRRDQTANQPLALASAL